jgi:branched-subunit amino acid ABC-type transport system permease component
MTAQVVLNGLVTGMVVALPAVALTLIYGILKFPNFAIGAMLTVGAYLALALNVYLSLPVLYAAAIGAAVFSVVAVGIDQAVFRPLRERSAITLLVASMGVSFVLENIVRFIFGNGARSFELPLARPKLLFGLRINNEQMVTAVAVIAAMAVVYVVLCHTPLGRAMRAVSDNPALAAARGIDRERIVRWTWVIAGLDRAIDPLIGWNYIVTVFAASILGGLGNPVGAVLGALTVGVVEETSTLLIPPNYRQVISFCAIALLLLLRPQGLLGAQRIKK